LVHLNSLPQGQPERYDRAVMMVEHMDAEGFGGCTNIGECSAVCPKEISLDFIAAMNRDLIQAGLRGKGKQAVSND
jgi:succinate dehydrogenase / fumarate reductase iron-sulfur subunit